MSDRLYPIGIQNFESLRKDGYLYVDKTRLIYRLATTGRYFFGNYIHSYNQYFISIKQ